MLCHCKLISTVEVAGIVQHEMTLSMMGKIFSSSSHFTSWCTWKHVILRQFSLSCQFVATFYYFQELILMLPTVEWI